MPDLLDDHLRLTGAYGREYTSIDAAVLHWNAGSDFKIVYGPYCSIRDTALIKADGYKGVAFYDRHLKLIGSIDFL